MEHYVTLFDSFFLPQGLALHRSMQRHAGAHTLWVLCMDAKAHEVLTTLALPNVRLIALADAETPELLRVKPSRTVGEYCWTITAQTPGFVFAREPSAQRVTYLDADLWFRQSPEPIFRELEASGKAVLITEHAYTAEFEQSHANGRYCVQFVTFVRERGEGVRQWWAERCIEWCYARDEDGKFGDQKYLDDWPERFGDSVHVLAEKELAQGPWNLARFPSSDAITYHFHGLRLLRGGHVLLTYQYVIHEGAWALLYRPYLADLAAAIKAMKAAGVAPRPQLNRGIWHQRAVLAGHRVFAAWRLLRLPRTARLDLD
jgi:hypothetical protein